MQRVVRTINLVDLVRATIAHAQQDVPALRALVMVHSHFVERAPLPVGTVRSCINSWRLANNTSA